MFLLIFFIYSFDYQLKFIIFAKTNFFQPMDFVKQ